MVTGTVLNSLAKWQVCKVKCEYWYALFDCHGFRLVRLSCIAKILGLLVCKTGQVVQ